MTKRAEFTGVWIDVALLGDARLTLSEKLLLAFTQTFRGKCFASDEHMANMLGISRKTVANCLSSLRKKGIITGRDFPKTGTRLPENGNETSRKREHRSKIEISKKERENAQGAFSYENPDDVHALLALLADRGIDEAYGRRAVLEVIGEVKAGHGEVPRNWATYCGNRARRLRLVDQRAERAKNARPAPVSQFSKTYS